ILDRFKQILNEIKKDPKARVEALKSKAKDLVINRKTHFQNLKNHPQIFYPLLLLCFLLPGALGYKMYLLSQKEKNLHGLDSFVNARGGKRPAYYKSELRTIAYKRLTIPIYFSSHSFTKKMRLDISLETTNRFSALYLTKK